MVPPHAHPASPQPRSSVEQAWALRSSDPLRAAALATALVDDSDTAIAAQAGATLAYAHLQTGHVDLALQTLDVAQGAAELAQSPVARARVNVARGALLVTTGQYADAVACMNLAQVDFARAGDDAGCAGVMVNRGLAHRHLGDHARALELLSAAAQRFRALDDTYGEAVALINTVQIFREVGDDQTARPLIERAWELAQQLDRVSFSTYVDAIRGAVLVSTGDRSDGMRILRKAAATAATLGLPQVQGEALGNLALATAATDPEEARRLLEPALDAVQQAGDAWTVCRALLCLGDCATSPTDARRAYQQAADLATLNSDQAMARQAHLGAAAACEQLQDSQGALHHWREAARACNRLSTQDRAQRLARVEIAIAHNELTARAQRDRQRIADLVTAGRARTDLVAMLAHDLRSPITSTTLLAEHLADSNPDPKVRETCDLILANQRRIARMLDLVADDAAAEHGRIVLHLRDEDLLLLLDLIVAEHRMAARAKRQWLQVEGRPQHLHLDAERLFHTIANLLDNAIKYSPLGSNITVRLLPQHGGARVEILDRGPGVNPTTAGDLFRPFTTGLAKPTGGEGSTGLGLHIARRMVELHGGRIGVSVRPDGPGSCFWFELPDPGGPAA